MTKTGKYDRHIRLYVTDEMHGFLKLLAERHDSSVAEEVRQAVRDHLDAQDDVIGSRSRLGRRVMTELEQMQHHLLGQIAHQGKLQLAATIVLLAEQGLRGPDIVKRITDLAARPELDRAVKPRA
jgi:hypothetical protein